VIGCFANDLAQAEPQRAHAVLKSLAEGGYVVSLRAPGASPVEAQAFCRRFGGGGRAAAAGIDRLPAADLDRFVAALMAVPWEG
jgi:nanoRNase/pAp phosphatase (c-di-AMP/oligoRNAs hydrolase)